MKERESETEREIGIERYWVRANERERVPEREVYTQVVTLKKSVPFPETRVQAGIWLRGKLVSSRIRGEGGGWGGRMWPLSGVWGVRGGG